MKVFHAFRLDTVNHCLWHGQERVSLAPKAFDVLRYLIEHADRLVTQDEILEALWPETYVNPEVIKKYVLGIRKVLGDQPGKPVFVATFPRRGYQFIAPVRDESAPSSPETTSPGTKTVVGREDALAQLESLLSKALQGQRQVVFVTGEAGIGKTTLTDLFHRQAAFWPNVRIARGQCVEGFGGKEAYYPMLEAVGQLMREAEGSPMVQALIERAPTWVVQFPSLVKAYQRDAGVEARRHERRLSRHRHSHAFCHHGGENHPQTIGMDQLLDLGMRNQIHFKQPLPVTSNRAVEPREECGCRAPAGGIAGPPEDAAGKKKPRGLRREALFGDQVDLFRRPSQPETDASHCARLAKSRHSTIREMVAHHRFGLGSPAAR